MLITCNACRFLPSHIAAGGITEVIKGHYLEPWSSWKKIPVGVRGLLFDEFVVRFKSLLCAFIMC